MLNYVILSKNVKKILALFMMKPSFVAEWGAQILSFETFHIANI